LTPGEDEDMEERLTFGKKKICAREEKKKSNVENVSE